MAFRAYTDTVEILENTKRLKGTPFSVDRGYPCEIYEVRKRLWPLLKENRTTHPRADVHIQYPARLMVDKTVIKDEFPDCFSVLKGKREVISHNVELLQTPLHVNSASPPAPSQQTNNIVCHEEQKTESMNERTFHNNNAMPRDMNLSQPCQQNDSSALKEVELSKVSVGTQPSSQRERAASASTSVPVSASTSLSVTTSVSPSRVVSASTSLLLSASTTALPLKAVSTSTSVTTSVKSTLLISESCTGAFTDSQPYKPVYSGPVTVVSDSAQTSWEQQTQFNIRNIISSLSSHATSFEPAQISGSDKHDHSIPILGRITDRESTSSRNDTLISQEPMDAVSSEKKGKKSTLSSVRTSTFKLPSTSDEPHLHLNSSVKTPRPRSTSQQRVRRDSATIPANDSRKEGGHVSRSRSVSRKTSPVRRKISNSITRNKIQRSAVSDCGNNKQTKVKSSSTGNVNC